jgi:hypothetical protein
VRRAALVLAVLGALLPAVDLIGKPGPDQFSFLEPVVTLSPSERQRIDAGEVVAHILPARDSEIAVFAASRLDAQPEALVRWTQAIESLKRSPFVIAIRRFSDPPVLSDLDTLVLDDADLEGIRQCQPGDCSVKLAAHEIESLKNVAAAGGDWKSAMQREFRRLLLKRVELYQAKGLSGLPPYVDREKPTVPRDEFAAILDRSPHLRNSLPGLASRLSNHSPTELPGTGSFLYWSKEHYGRGKPVISVTQVHIIRPTGSALPDVAVIGQEVFASHYRDGSLGTTFVLDGGASRYLAYVNRSRLDRLDGIIGGLKRSVVERKLRSEVKTAIEGVRRRLESGNPS